MVLNGPSVRDLSSFYGKIEPSRIRGAVLVCRGKTKADSLSAIRFLAVGLFDWVGLVEGFVGKQVGDAVAAVPEEPGGALRFTAGNVGDLCQIKYIHAVAVIDFRGFDRLAGKKYQVI